MKLSLQSNRDYPQNIATMHSRPFSLLAALLASIATLSADDQAGLGTLRSRADGGDVKAQLDLACRYRDGKGVAKNDAEAMKWARSTATDTAPTFATTLPEMDEEEE